MAIKRIIFTILWITLLLPSVILCQIQITQNQPDNGNKTYIARDQIEFDPKYQYSSKNGQSMRAYTDNNKIEATNYVNLSASQSSFDTRPINYNLEVGFTPGKEAVSPTGGGLYSIPIALPSGTNGLTPTIALTYNSQGGNGIAGYGWDISGLSIISRTPKTIYHDGKVDPVKIDNSDIYSLDGNRLLAVNGLYGANNTKYRTEQESFAQITSYINSGSLVDWFKVESKEGATVEYGNSADSKIFAEGSSSPIAWRITKLIDNFGNYILFKYKNVGRENVIDEILYTGNTAASLAPFCSIKFVYENRSDKNFVFIAGSKVESNLLLTKIIVNISGSKLCRRYELRYGFDMYSFLTEIQEFGSENKPLNSTIFKYGDKTVPFERSYESVLRGASSDIIPGDFNGDGYTDFVSADYTYHPNNAMKYHTNYSLYINNLGSYNLVGSPQALPPFLFEIDETKSKVSISNLLSLYNSDYNGDGKEDLAIPVKTYNNGYTTLDYTLLYYSNGAGFNSVTIPSPATNKVIYPGSSTYFIPGDFDGDGATDFICFLSDKSSYKTYIVYPRTGITNYLVIGQSSFLARADDLLVLDFNGDGKNDLMFTKDGNTTIYSFEKSGSQVNAKILYNAGYPTKWHKVFPGDFNGDGKTDLLSSGNGTIWEIGFSTGNSFVSETQNFPFNLGISNSNQFSAYADRIKIGDYNGDGKSDILNAKAIWSNGSSSSYYLNIYYRQSQSFILDGRTVSGVLGGSYIKENYRNIGFVSLDVNGDGKTDEIMKTHYQTPLDVFTFNKWSKEFYLEKIKNGHNYLTSFSYSPLSRGFLYTKGNSAIYPLIDFQAPIQVVIKISNSDGVGGLRNINYAYEEALLHRQGKGFLGFKKTTTTDYTGNKNSISENDLNLTYFVLSPKSQKVYRLDNNVQLSSSADVIAFNNLGGKRYFRYTSQNLTIDYLQGFNTHQTFAYDGNGNLTNATKNIGGGIEFIEIINQYITSGAWLPSKLSSTTVKNTRTGQSVYSRTSTYEYDSRGALLREKRDNGQPKMVTTNFTYNTLGNMTGKNVQATGLPSVSTLYEFDVTGRYPIKITNTLSQSEEISYDIVTGLPLKKKGIDGLIETFEYNGFGGLKKAVNSRGIESTNSYGWKTSANNQNTLSKAIYFISSQRQGSPSSKVWYDLLGREIFSETEGINNGLNNTTFIERQYDQRGNIVLQTNPYFAGDTPVKTINDYDGLNRLVKSSLDIYATNYSYSYSGGLATVATTTPANQQYSQTTDPTGKIVSAADNGGTLTYEYFSNGQQKKINLSGVEIASMEYDIYGNQTKLVDKNAGITTYEYNAYRQLTKQVDANSNQYLLQYDAAGRLTIKTGPDGTTTYQYIQSGKGLNQLYKITASNGTSQEYGYDYFGRINMEKETIGSDNFTTLFEYDQYDNQIGQTYPSGFKIKRDYDPNGYLLAVTGRTGVFFHKPIMNALGQYTEYKQGGLLNNKSYNNLGFLTSSKVLGNGYVQNLQYTFNPQTGNLIKINDLQKGLGETFTYDNLNRLIDSKVDGQPSIAVTYAPNGNILSKSDIGQYTYDPIKSNAVSSITPPSNTVLTALTQNTTYTPFQKVSSISQGTYQLDFTYGPDYTRKKTVLKTNGNVTATKLFLRNYEKVTNGSLSAEIHYIFGGEGLTGLYVKESGVVGKYYHVITDHLGSIRTLIDDSGLVAAEQNFDAWGRSRDPNLYTYNIQGQNPWWLDRGFTGHEHLKEFGLVNMNARLYEPIVGRVLSPDDFVQSPLYTQNYNRYSYALNNPLIYTDPTGDVIWIPIAIGAAFGGFAGYQIAHSKGYDFNDWQTYGYIAGGAVIGGASGYLSHLVSTSGMIGANTAGIVASSFSNSVGMHILSGGNSDVSLSIGFASYNISQNSFDYFLEKGNSNLEDIGYGFGALANLQDIIAWNHGTKIDVLSRKKLAGHSEVRGKDVSISVGPDRNAVDLKPDANGLEWESQYLTHSVHAENSQYINIPRGDAHFSSQINNINGNILNRMTNNLNQNCNLLGFGSFKYGVMRGCVNYTSRALLYAGVPTVNAFLPITSPVFLNFELAVRQMGIYSSPYLIR